MCTKNDDAWNHSRCVHGVGYRQRPTESIRVHFLTESSLSLYTHTHTHSNSLGQASFERALARNAANLQAGGKRVYGVTRFSDETQEEFDRRYKGRKGHVSFKFVRYSNMYGEDFACESQYHCFCLKTKKKQLNLH
jgi:hypothetical protein